ncbi:TRAP transporter small permease subunit [Amphritea japonica]|uniref:TRAP transporter small permease protein n=1 Tax=Amphritea japonica ATCC BAA-1530 TaxID=1278309 RepID=A0A7R6SSW1_9GAMM|nr:TRAP transporter small permease [Amphritea japonica]BBB26686.1 TRAP dicarboxylate transporter DctQ subunit [Amphritea japonica ATCC BAA-1530]
MFKKILIKFCCTIDWVVRQAGLLASFIMPVLAFVVAYEVFSRYVLGSPTIWAFDLSLFMFGYLAALGGAYAQQQRAHINVDILYLKVSHKTRCIFNLISFSLAIFFLVVIVMMSWGKYEEAIEFDYRRQSEWAPPMFHFWIMMMVAGGLFIAQLARDMLAELYFLLTSTALIEEAQ